MSPVQPSCQPHPLVAACVLTETCSWVPCGLYFVSLQKYVHVAPVGCGNQSSARADEPPTARRATPAASTSRTMDLLRPTTRMRLAVPHELARSAASANPTSRRL